MSSAYSDSDPTDSSNDTASQFRDRAVRLRALGYNNAADECDAAADALTPAFDVLECGCDKWHCLTCSVDRR